MSDDTMQENNQKQYLWWQDGIIYQVYPRSFQDANGDGIGDLRGMILRLEYLKTLGVKAIWLSPIYPSPMADFGYDISDYRGIWPTFGSMADFDELLANVHAMGMKLILDLVPNHSSDEHPWFLESRSSRDNPKRDWYIWKDAKPDGGLPNNWLSVFGGPAWEWDGKTGQYYYHAFHVKQPDLNWRNPQVEKAMLDIMRWWLDKGVDGFRVDAMWHMIKDAQWRDNPRNPDYKESMGSYEQLLPVYSTDQPEMHGIAARMRKVLDEYHQRLMIAEIYLPVHRLVAYYGTHDREAHLPFNFTLTSLPWDSRSIAAAIDEYEAALPDTDWPNWVMGNHDQPRISSRVGLGQSKVAAVLLLTLRGTPTLYYGDEIGMRDVPIPPGEVQDPQGLNMPGKNLSRDPERTPMQWDQTRNGGFTAGQPWLRIDRSFRRRNVATQEKDEYSPLCLYHKLIRLRQQEPSLMVGAYKPVYSDTQLLAYIRQADGHPGFLIVLNLTHRPGYFTPSTIRFTGVIVVDSFPEQEQVSVKDSLDLFGDEGLIVRLDDWRAVSTNPNPHELAAMP
ncbi:MAG TPA: alpha-amylase family glycosyl hydrolase [Puia sp.]|uniref:alpha-amylase family glycosyl hydrolase n=1 Tax=Puia sp. TaxID=2045100 RepID=UPI002C1B4D3A|nr:alpha-amylase family glycosyl hydrolase [Puia sp.]HVU98164.1 alpha-amylase family glycosyl hydrolase [Puia sp.]